MTARGNGVAEGFTLIEVLIGLGIGSIVVLAATAYLNYFNQASTYSQAVQTRDSLLAQVKSLGASLKVLQASALAPENLALSQCLSGVSCNSTEGPLSLYPTTSIVNTLPFSGPAVPTPKPRLYSIYGVPCPMTAVSPNPQCPLEVSTSFIAQCPANPPINLTPPATCSGPTDLIEIIYTIQGAVGIPIGPEGNAQLAPYTGTIVVRGPHL